MRSKQLSEPRPEDNPPPSQRCIALVLAAGRGTRFGSDKRLARLSDGRTLLAATLSRVQAQFAEVWVVIRADDDPRALGLGSDVKLVRAAQAADGMGASLAAGMAALAGSDAQAVAVLLADMPWIKASTLGRLANAAHAELIVMPCVAGRRGHPVLFGRRFWGELMRVCGDRGGRQVLNANPQACRQLDVDDHAVLLDVDTPQDLPRR